MSMCWTTAECKSGPPDSGSTRERLQEEGSFGGRVVPLAFVAAVSYP